MSSVQQLFLCLKSGVEHVLLIVSPQNVFFMPRCEVEDEAFGSDYLSVSKILWPALILL